jgi:DNA invertase Pin-like site-specific DNA recombinase
MDKGKGTRKRVAIYVRVSTDGQTTRNQQRELDAVAKRHGWNIVAVFKDHGISGKNGREQRPGFDKLLRGVARKEFDLGAAWSVDRLGRSLQHLLGFLNELKAKDVDLYLHQQAVDTTTPAGRALFQMLGVFAEFERSMVVERVKAGLKRATAEGKTLGRPRISADVETAIRRHLGEGRLGIHKIARLVGVGSGTVQRVREQIIVAKAGRYTRTRRQRKEAQPA